MADQLLLQLKLMTTLESALDKALRPLPQQNELLQAADRSEGPASERRQGRKPSRDRGSSPSDVK
jgi:hypothetical protein